MTVRGALREAIGELSSARVPSASTTAEVLLLHVLARFGLVGDRTFLYAHPEAELTGEQERAYRELVGARAAGTPTQYLTRRQEFWGLGLGVEPGVFIPRPETEHVVEAALEIVRERLRKPAARIVDVGTGTGCIALALASELPQAEIVATDVSEPALGVARRNAAALGFAPRVRFVRSDLLEAFLTPVHGSRVADHEPRFDLVVSNPPYVSADESERLPREVREHEPPAALFSSGEGLEVTRRLIAQAAQLLSSPATGHRPPATGPALRSPQGEGGWLVLELGYNLAGRVRALLGDAWASVEITNDLRGIPRVLAAQKK